MFELPEAEQALVDLVRRFVDDRVRPVARALEHADEYPEDIIEQMKAMGLFGLAVEAPYAEPQASAAALALVTEELSRGWMSLGGTLGGHSVVSKLICRFGTDDQRARYLPAMATGSLRATMALTEPAGGSDLAAITTVARRDGAGYLVNGSKMWITNAMRSGLLALLCKTNPQACPPHRGISILLVEKDPGSTTGPGVTVGPGLGKLGYRGVESCEINFDGCRVPTGALLGGAEGHGFPQMMNGLELGRIQVAARAVGVARAAFEDALAYAQQRETFGKPIWRHQSIGNHLADMATRLTASRLLILNAAERFDRGERADLEAGMAKLFASEAAMENALTAMRVHGAYGYSTDYDVERYFRDAPLMIVGEGTNEIQRNVIAAQLVARGGLGDGRQP